MHKLNQMELKPCGQEMDYIVGLFYSCQGLQNANSAHIYIHTLTFKCVISVKFNNLNMFVFCLTWLTCSSKT